MEGEALVAFRVTLHLCALTTKRETLTPLKAENSHQMKISCAMPVVSPRVGRYCACWAHLQLDNIFLLNIYVSMILFMPV
jgi:hypothetical protein